MPLITISTPVPQPRPGWPSPLPKLCHVLSDLSWPHTNPVKEAGQVLSLFPLYRWGNCRGGSMTCSGPPREHTSQLLVRLLLLWTRQAKGIRPSPLYCPRTSGLCRGSNEPRGLALPSGRWASAALREAASPGPPPLPVRPAFTSRPTVGGRAWTGQGQARLVAKLGFPPDAVKRAF